MQYEILVLLVFIEHIVFNLWVGRRLLSYIEKTVLIISFHLLAALSIIWVDLDMLFISILYLINFIIIYRSTKEYHITAYYMVCEYLIVQISLICSFSLFSYLTNSDYDELKNKIFYFLILLMIIIFGFCTMLFSKIYNKFEVLAFFKLLSKKHKIGMSIFLSLFILFAYLQAIFEEEYWLYTIILFLMAFIIIGGSYLLVQLKLYYDELGAIVTQYDREMMSLNEVKEFKHDYKGVLFTLANLIDKGDLAGAAMQLQEITEYSSSIVQEDISISLNRMKNLPIKSVLFLEIKKATDLGVSVTVNIDCEINEIPVNLLDLTRCLTIIMDNAIEASCELTNANIELVINKNLNMLKIIVENNYDKRRSFPLSQIEKKGITTKENHLGLGLQNLHKIVGAYENMDYDLYRDHKKFRVTLMIDDIKQ
ncbi:GHKL domain-containing protein [Enterococcus mundtii]|uniref:Sensor histidine kinase NatK-like C-terminal domain-containing protein n=2 Tax=Enterococcus mundtii TaxID=53346 RepID=A0A242KVE0_ENTMU|nr:GHKL domain-containing protein [Enterococcus mundtii]OTP24820.1 hypothetical protein A5802_002975 [Enterococcus mundtii]